MTINGASDPVAEAAGALRELGEAGRMVAEEVRADREQRRRTDRVVMALLVVVAIAVGAVAWGGFSSYRLSATVADCTTPGGQCYEAGKAQAAANRSALTRANLFIVACARPGMTEQTMTDCVKEKLAEAGIDIALIDPDGTAGTPVPSAPTGPPADASIAPASSDQPVEPEPVQPPATDVPGTDDPAEGAGDTGGATP